MYELDEPSPHVAHQIDGLPRRAWNDYEAALAFIREQPFDAELSGTLVAGRSPRYRAFGLGRGLVVYQVDPLTNRIQLELVRFLAQVDSTRS